MGTCSFMKLRKPNENRRINKEMLNDKPEELEESLEQFISKLEAIKDMIIHEIQKILGKQTARKPKTIKRSLKKSK
jgi:hypothetical protein